MLLKNWTMRVSGICEEAEDDTDVEGNVGWRMHLKTPVFARGFWPLKSITLEQAVAGNNGWDKAIQSEVSRQGCALPIGQSRIILKWIMRAKTRTEIVPLLREHEISQVMTKTLQKKYE
jgi:hypothetical protein